MYKADTRATPILFSTRRLPLLAWLKAIPATRRQRRQLAEMTDAQLSDLGISYRDARSEAQKPIWDVPQYWMR